jgi:3-oxoadipate enol-lactonase
MTEPQVETGFADVNGTSMYYEVAGSGEPLVLVHAGIADSRMWDAQFSVFARERTVVRFDLRGYGKTPAVAGAFSHHEDLAELLKHLGIERTALLGCSMGGRTIIDFAVAHPGVASALIPVAAGVSGYQSEASDPPEWGAVIEAYERGDLERASELEVQIWVDGPQRGPGEVPASIRDKVREMNLIPLAVPDDLGDDQRQLEPLAVGRLHEIDAPTLVIMGALDQPMEAEQSGYIAAHTRGARLVTMDTAHLPNMERPDEFNEIVLDFLRSLDGGEG